MAEQQNKDTQKRTEQDLNQLLKVRREKLENLQAAGKDPFRITKYNQSHHSSDIRDNYDSLEGQNVSLAGRIMSKRVMQKRHFAISRI